MEKIGSNHGREALRLKLHRMDDPASAGDFAIDNVLGVPGEKYPNNAPNVPVEGTLQKLVDGHNETVDAIAQLREELRLRPF